MKTKKNEAGLPQGTILYPIPHLENNIKATLADKMA